MQNIKYLKPASLSEALALLGEYRGSARIYAGGTDLMVQLRDRDKKLMGVEYLVDCTSLPEMMGIEVQDGQIRIGAMVSHTDASQSAILQKEAPFLAQAAATVGSPQIRNMGTLGGNICNGSPAADTLSPLVALDASMVIQSTEGTRKCLVKDMYSEKGEILLADNELAVCFEIPRLKGLQSWFTKLGRRKALAISRMNVAAALQMQDGVILSAHLVPGCVFIAPDRMSQIEDFMVGKKVDAKLFEKAGEMTADEMVARTGVRWSTEYKRPVIASLVSRTLKRAAGLEEGE